jgi:hypothetical protein
VKKVTRQQINRLRTNIRRSTVENATVNNANLLAAAHNPNNIFILNNFSQRGNFFGMPLKIRNGEHYKSIKLTSPKAFQWHTNQHGNIVACVPSRNETISTECLVRNVSGNLKQVKYTLQYPQALVFNSSKTHRAPNNRKTGASLFKLKNKSIYNALKRGDLQANNIHSFHNLLS